ncbi:MAG: hypothetical protein R2777_04855 [Chitinophagales bacterium]
MNEIKETINRQISMLRRENTFRKTNIEHTLICHRLFYSILVFDYSLDLWLPLCQDKGKRPQTVIQIA